jgi:large subunit ribosomal protein L4
MRVTAYTATGEPRSEAVELPASLFDGRVSESALHQVVTAIELHGRQGTAATRSRGAVRGGGRKPWRQKGTGRARVGTIRSPLWRGGAVTFGPQPRSYDVRIPRKLKRLAIRSALNARAADGDLAVIEPVELEAPRTKQIAELIGNLEASGSNVLLLTDGIKRTVLLSARNLPGVKVLPWGEASAVDVLWADLVLIESSALDSADLDSTVEKPDEGAEGVEG